MAVALYHQHKTGEATRARTSLAAITNLAQASFAFDYAGRGPFDEPSGREALGYDALSHFYATRDGWLYLDSSRSELLRLERIEGLVGIAEANSIADFLTAAFRQAPMAYWVEVLQAAD